MTAVFTALLDRSMAAGWLILAVLLLRLALKKAPKAVHCLLWLLVGVRLVSPISIESALSLIPSTQLIQPTASGSSFRVSTGISAVNSVVNPYLADHYYEGITVPLGLRERVTQVCAWVWLTGAAALLLYSLVSYLRLRRRVSTAVRLEGALWQCDQIASPFILGLFRPRIYLPFHLDGADLDYVVAHERTHLRRRDHWWKPLGFLILTVYWFHPLVWAAYVLLCRDIELACDEQVIRQLGTGSKAAYSHALLNCSVNRRSVAACPLAFGEVGVKQRVKNILNYKRPAFWVLLASLIACAAAAVCFLTDPVDLCRELYPGDRGFEDHVNYGVADCEDPYAALMAVLQDAEPLRADGTSASYSPDLLADFTIPGLAQVHDFFTLTADGRTVVDISYQTEDGTEVVVEYMPDGGFYKLAARRPLRLRKQVSYTYAPSSPLPEQIDVPSPQVNPASSSPLLDLTGGPLLWQSAALSSLFSDISAYSFREADGVLTVRQTDGEDPDTPVYEAELTHRETYAPEALRKALPDDPINDPARLLPEDLEEAELRHYGDKDVTIWELRRTGGKTELWLSQGGPEGVWRIFALLDLGDIFPPGAAEALWTAGFDLGWTVLPVRFVGDFASVELTAQTGTISLTAPWEAEGTVLTALTVKPGDTVYWDLSCLAAEEPENIVLSFAIDPPNGTAIRRSLSLRPASEYTGLCKFRTYGISVDWLPLYSSSPHSGIHVAVDPVDGAVVVSINPPSRPEPGD